MSEQDDEVWFNGKGEKLRSFKLFGVTVVESETGQVTREDPGAIDTYLESVPPGTIPSCRPPDLLVYWVQEKA